MNIRLVAGLGNPGPEYRDTRHNAGFQCVDRMAERLGVSLKDQAKFFGRHGRLNPNAASPSFVRLSVSEPLSLLEPTCWMNHSGRSVAACAAFYRIQPAEILVVHDELDLEPGCIRLKTGGGHGGHNGLRDIVSNIGGSGFHRLRVGIGHPGHANRVVSWVLSRPGSVESNLISDAIERALDSLPEILAGDFAGAMNRLHKN
ncbi:MAG: peptidyl-tRNA hydrolase [marine bacterium B5-7]|nr:MAG: peptidyl-tRNA hydrolase [marine bacterium B5-7]